MKKLVGTVSVSLQVLENVLSLVILILILFSICCLLFYRCSFFLLVS